MIVQRASHLNLYERFSDEKLLITTIWFTAFSNSQKTQLMQSERTKVKLTSNDTMLKRSTISLWHMVTFVLLMNSLETYFANLQIKWKRRNQAFRKLLSHLYRASHSREIGIFRLVAFFKTLHRFSGFWLSSLAVWWRQSENWIKRTKTLHFRKWSMYRKSPMNNDSKVLEVPFKP